MEINDILSWASGVEPVPGLGGTSDGFDVPSLPRQGNDRVDPSIDDNAPRFSCPTDSIAAASSVANPTPSTNNMPAALAVAARGCQSSLAPRSTNARVSKRKSNSARPNIRRPAWLRTIRMNDRKTFADAHDNVERYRTADGTLDFDQSLDSDSDSDSDREILDKAIHAVGLFVLGMMKRRPELEKSFLTQTT